MRTPIEDIILRLRTISDLANQESDSMRVLFPEEDIKNRQSSQEIKSQLLLEPLPCLNALYGYLSGLPKHVLFFLMAAMYIGRDGESDIYGFFSELMNAHSVDGSALDAIAGKFPRMEYIDDGINIIGKERIGAFIVHIEKLVGSSQLDAHCASGLTH